MQLFHFKLCKKNQESVRNWEGRRAAQRDGDEMRLEYEQMCIFAACESMRCRNDAVAVDVGIRGGYQ
jgi:hypothetical protein